MQSEAYFETLAAQLRAFSQARDWDQFHTPQSLASSISIESAELLELFQWGSQADTWASVATADKLPAIKDELADVLIYLTRFADLASIDLSEAVAAKISKNIAKYPADKVRGSSKKYDTYD